MTSQLDKHRESDHDITTRSSDRNNVTGSKGGKRGTIENPEKFYIKTEYFLSSVEFWF